MNIPYTRPRAAGIAEGTVERDMEANGAYGGLEGGPTYRIHYRVTYAGCPAQGPSYSSGGQPAEGPEWEITMVEGEVNTPAGTIWTDIRKMGLDPLAVDAVEGWAENLDLSEECDEAATDMAELYREQRDDARNDR